MKMASNWYRLRWIILNRDSFTCQYCGRKAPDVILQVDHKISRLDGGTDDKENLLTSCTACNIGKNSDSLGISPTDTSSSPKTLRAKRPKLFEERVRHYLETVPDGATATIISKALGCNRTNVSKYLSNNPILKKTRKGASVYYHIK